MNLLSEISLAALGRKGKAYAAKKAKDSVNWLKSQIAKLTGSKKSLGSFSEKGSAQLEPGKMVFFKYDAKHKETLPYYDMLPLSIIVDILPDGFTGLNLHYLPPKVRAIFLLRLDETLNNKKMNKTTRFQVTYGMLKATSKLKFFAPCFKRYLGAHIKSKINIIKPDQWHNAVMLPASKFTGASKAAVWKDSKRMYQ